ncbi:hypothetical protein B0H10DRAFT_2233885 [Mycena sp. CBHHK59/15]|nr:hypothetical protein B0H10DRAFT_2233885 [Mycena sp. CBHHK59/15]
MHQESASNIVIVGGLGGKGGKGAMRGGDGGRGEGPRLLKEDVFLFASINGGTGGAGGEGGATGGSGGTGESPRLAEPLVPPGTRLPDDLSVQDFCKKYGLHHALISFLEEQGFTTVGALAFLNTFTLEDAGLRMGQIAELKNALNKLVDDDGW